MSEKRKGILIHLIMGAIIAGGVIWLKASENYALTRQLCDGCFVAGALLMGFGGLKFARNQGVFDIFSFGIKSAFHLHFPFVKMNSPLNEREELFADYKERKRQVRKSAAEPLWAGLCYVVLSVIMLVVHYSVNG